MTVEITMTFASAAEAAEFLADRLKPAPDAAGETRGRRAKPEAKTEAKPEAKTEVKTEVKTEAKTEAKPEAKGTLADTPFPDTGLPTLMTKIAKSKPDGRAMVIEVMKAFGVSRGSELAPKDFDRAHAAFTELEKSGSVEKALVAAGFDATPADEDMF